MWKSACPKRLTVAVKGLHLIFCLGRTPFFSGTVSEWIAPMATEKRWLVGAHHVGCQILLRSTGWEDTECCSSLTFHSQWKLSIFYAYIQRLCFFLNSKLISHQRTQLGKQAHEYSRLRVYIVSLFQGEKLALPSCHIHGISITSYFIFYLFFQFLRQPHYSLAKLMKVQQHAMLVRQLFCRINLVELYLVWEKTAVSVCPTCMNILHC
jgi:hypothetical protein